MKRAIFPWLLCWVLLLPVSGWAGEPLVIYMFSSDRCPHCKAQEPFLENLADAESAVEFQRFEVSATRDHHGLFRAMARTHGVDAGSVPAVFVGGRAWVGDSPAIRAAISSHVAACLQRDCPDSRLLTDEPVLARRDRPADSTLRLPLLGQVDLAVQPLAVATFVIAFVDGFNPCSLWVLTILLALVVHSRSRRRVLIVGLTFLTVTAALYGVFITGVFTVLHFLAYLQWVYWLVAAFALVFAIVNIKDYFWFKRGISFTIDDKHKPGMFKNMRALLKEGRSLPALIGATALMAAGIALIELPCTAGFPVIWSSLVASHDVGWPYFAWLLLIYLVVYLSIELVIFFIALISLRMDRFEESHGRYLKLIGGLIMLVLALLLVFAPDVMQDVAATLAAFGIALGLAFFIILVHRRLLPAFGIKLGDDWKKE